MPVNIARTIEALIHHLKDADIEEMPPAVRRRFAAVCRHAAAVAERAETMGAAPKAGILADLHQGQRGE